MAVSEFIPFATAPGANVATYDQWVQDPVTLEGFTIGLLPSAKVNKAWRQSCSMAAAIGNLIVQYLDQDALDNGNIGTLTGQIAAVIHHLGGGTSGSFPDAPLTGGPYLREAGTWIPLADVPVKIDGGTF